MTGQSKPIKDTEDGPVQAYSEHERELIGFVASVCGVTPHVAGIALEAAEFDSHEAIDLISMGQDIAPKGNTDKSKEASIVDRENSVMECVGVDREIAQAALFENDNDPLAAVDALTNMWEPAPLSDRLSTMNSTCCPTEPIDSLNEVKIFSHAIRRTECDFRMVYLFLVKTQSILKRARSSRLYMLTTTTKEVNIVVTNTLNLIMKFQVCITPSE